MRLRKGGLGWVRDGPTVAGVRLCRRGRRAWDEAAPGEGLNPIPSNDPEGWGQRAGRRAGRTCLLPQAEDGSLGSDPVLSRDELDALLGEVRHSGGGATNKQSPSTGDMSLVCDPQGDRGLWVRQGQPKVGRGAGRKGRVTPLGMSRRAPGTGSCSGRSRAWGGPSQTPTGSLPRAGCAGDGGAGGGWLSGRNRTGTSVSLTNQPSSITHNLTPCKSPDKTRISKKQVKAN